MHWVMLKSKEYFRALMSNSICLVFKILNVRGCLFLMQLRCVKNVGIADAMYSKLWIVVIHKLITIPDLF